jgi:hypothetical protein
MKQVSIIIILLSGFFSVACKKDSFITSKDARISCSVDTLRFDTVFTSVGSITQLIKIKNGNNQKLLLTDITLKGGSISPFKININGTSTTKATNIEMEANDSLYIFVAVSVNATSVNTPFIVTDSIEIRFNGSIKTIQLEAWGQNANFLRNRRISTNTTWANTLPYVILDGLQVDINATLTIEKGCRIYLHTNAAILVDGTLQVNGEAYDSTRVYFTGDRRDVPYKDFPGSWPGIYFRATSKNNVLTFATINNAYQAIVVQQPATNANPKLVLNECIVNNSLEWGIAGIQSSINARNCLISNCGKNTVLTYGGDYQFIHCTSAAIGDSYVKHKEPALSLSNYVFQGNTTVTDNLTAVFTNCIFWGENGNVDDEVVVSKQGTTAFSVSFDHCLWKVKNTPVGVVSNNIINDQSPLFDSINTDKRFYSFKLKNNPPGTLSPGINKGTSSGVFIDLEGEPRPVGMADIGCYESQ